MSRRLLAGVIILLLASCGRSELADRSRCSTETSAKARGEALARIQQSKRPTRTVLVIRPASDPGSVITITDVGVDFDLPKGKSVYWFGDIARFEHATPAGAGWEIALKTPGKAIMGTMDLAENVALPDGTGTGDTVGVGQASLNQWRKKYGDLQPWRSASARCAH